MVFLSLVLFDLVQPIVIIFSDIEYSPIDLDEATEYRVTNIGTAVGIAVDSLICPPSGLADSAFELKSMFLFLIVEFIDRSDQNYNKTITNIPTGENILRNNEDDAEMIIQEIDL